MPPDDRSPSEAETLQILSDSRAILDDDHFVYISGDHGSGWIDKDAIFINLARVERLGQLLADVVRDLKPDLLCGPATGGLIVAQWTAAALGLPAIFADHAVKHGAQELRGHFVLRRGYDRMVPGQRVLVVDDVVNTGHSMRETAEAVRQCGGKVIAAAAFVHRGNVDAAGIGGPEYRYLFEYDIPKWPGTDCPLCKSGVPVNTRYAHGQDFLDEQAEAQP